MYIMWYIVYLMRLKNIKNLFAPKSIESAVCSQESARAKAQGAKIWGQGAGQGVLAQGKAKAKGGKSGKGVAKTGAAGKVG